MAFYADEEEVWKCPKHPSKRRRTGICPTCLRERLGTLCPDCGNVRPCGCYATRTTSSLSSSSSSLSSFSIFSSASSTSAAAAASSALDGVGPVGRVGSLIESEPAFRRSRSVGVTFLRSRFAASGKENLPASGKAKTPSLWSVFKRSKSKKRGDLGTREGEESNENENNNMKPNEESNYSYNTRIHDFENMMKRSRSMSAAITSSRGRADVKSSTAKGKGWHFPSPMKVFRQRSLSKVVQDRSPLHRG